MDALDGLFWATPAASREHDLDHCGHSFDGCLIYTGACPLASHVSRCLTGGPLLPTPFLTLAVLSIGVPLARERFCFAWCRMQLQWLVCFSGRNSCAEDVGRSVYGVWALLWRQIERHQKVERAKLFWWQILFASFASYFLRLFLLLPCLCFCNCFALAALLRFERCLVTRPLTFVLIICQWVCMDNIFQEGATAAFW